MDLQSFCYVCGLYLSIFNLKCECSGFFSLFLPVFVLGIITSTFEFFKLCSCFVEIHQSYREDCGGRRKVCVYICEWCDCCES
jgi:hypothetical protein